MYSETSYGNGFFTVIKAALCALSVSLLMALGFAVLLRAGNIGERWIYPTNQVLKSVSIIVGVCTFVRGEKGWLKGVGTGLFFTALSYLAFSAIGGDFSLGWLILLEILTAVLVGGISGILTVNLKK